MTAPLTRYDVWACYGEDAEPDLDVHEDTNGPRVKSSDCAKVEALCARMAALLERTEPTIARSERAIRHLHDGADLAPLIREALVAWKAVSGG